MYYGGTCAEVGICSNYQRISPDDMQVAAPPSTAVDAWSFLGRPVRTRPAAAVRSFNSERLTGWGARRRVTARTRCSPFLKHSVATPEVVGMGLEAGVGSIARIQKRAAPCVRAQAAGLPFSPAMLILATLPSCRAFLVIFGIESYSSLINYPVEAWSPQEWFLKLRASKFCGWNTVLGQLQTLLISSETLIFVSFVLLPDGAILI